MNDQKTATKPRNERKKLLGVVVSDKMEKTIVVRVERTSHHAQYQKVLHLRRKFYAHDQERQAKVGDKVEIASTRPLSRQKRWRLVRIVEKAPQE